MPTVQVPAQLTVKHLLTALKQLSPEELREFVEKATKWQARQEKRTANHDEAALVKVATTKLPPSTLRRMKRLTLKARAHNITDEERAELLQLVQEVEQRDAQRLEALIELARRRGTDLKGIMRQLRVKESKDVI